MRQAIFENIDRRKRRYSDLQQNQHLDTSTLSPFVLNIPVINPRESSPLAAHPDEQLDDFDDLQRGEFRTLPSRVKKPIRVTKPRNRVPKPLERSRYGIPYPSLPPIITKRIASTFNQSLGSKKPRLGKETLEAIMEASDQYFEQFSEDLGAFAHHAGRKKIDESDAIAVMKR